MGAVPQPAHQGVREAAPGPPVRVLAAKVGLDGHDRGIKVIVRALRDAGMEVIYSGLFRTPDEVARTALDEDVDVVAISILSGAHNTLIPQVLQRLQALGIGDVPVVVGGTIPADDVPGLIAAGVRRVFGPGSDLGDIVGYIRSLGEARRRPVPGAKVAESGGSARR